MANSFLFNDTPNTPDAETHGITEIRQKTIGRMIAKGLPVKYVAKKLQMSESRVYHLLSDKESIVNAEINRILGQIFTATDRYLVKLFKETLENLDTMLSGKDKEKQFRAMDRVIKIYMARCTKNGVTVKQYFGLEAPGQQEYGWDDFIQFHHKMMAIMERARKGRGLPSEDRELPFIKNLIKSVLETAALLGLDTDIPKSDVSEKPSPGDSSQGTSASPASTSPTTVSQTAASNESSPDNPSPDASDSDESSAGIIPPDVPQEVREFLDDMNETSPSG